MPRPDDPPILAVATIDPRTLAYETATTVLLQELLATSQEIRDLLQRERDRR